MAQEDLTRLSRHAPPSSGHTQLPHPIAPETEPGIGVDFSTSQLPCRERRNLSCGLLAFPYATRPDPTSQPHALADHVLARGINAVICKMLRDTMLVTATTS